MNGDESGAYTYAWNWFSLHSAQRLQLVNFWLVSVAFLGTAFVQAHSGKLSAVATGVAVAGMVASLAFMQLDARTRQLVQIAEKALLHLENAHFSEGSSGAFALVHAAGNRRIRWRSYRAIIQGLQLSVAILFLFAAIYSMA